MKRLFSTVSVVKLWEMNPKVFLSNQTEGKKNKSKSFWVQKTDDNLAHTWEVSQGRMKRFFSTVSSLKLRERTPEHF